MSDERLHTDLLGIAMKTPVLTASGTFGFGEEFKDFVDLSRLGGVMVKGTTLLPRRGNDGVRITETPEGMLNCIGLENPGVEHFLDETLPRIQQYGMNVIVNISGSTAEEYGKLAELLDVPGVAAIELNVSCPNVKEGGIVFGTDPEAAAAVVREAKAHTKKPVILKLSPNVTDIVVMAKAVEAAGADAVSLINTLLGMEIDIHRFRPVLGNITGGLSGPCVKPVAVRMVWQVAQAVRAVQFGISGSGERALDARTDLRAVFGFEFGEPLPDIFNNGRINGRIIRKCVKRLGKGGIGVARVRKAVKRLP